MISLESTLDSGLAGAPVCDARGAVLGMVLASPGLDGGPAGSDIVLPAADIDSFLADNLADYDPGTLGVAPLKAGDLERLARSSIVRVHAFQ